MNSFQSLDAARNEFHRIFSEWTGNEFNATEFVKKPGKYNKIDIDHETLDHKIAENSKPTKLSEPLFKLMQLLFNENMIQSTLKAFYFDLGSLPLGLVHKRTIQSAIGLLEKISTMLKGKNTQNSHEIMAASNQFYSYFPEDSGLQRVSVINTPQMIKEKTDMLRHVLNKVETYNMFASRSTQEKNLIDVCYDHLQNYAEIRPLNKKSQMYAQINKYMKNSQTYSNRTQNSAYSYGQNTLWEVDEIFEVTRHEEEIRYEPHESNFNRQLLIHGTSINNYVSILTHGLKFTARGQHAAGLFGQGVYFADSLTKSAGYCRATGGMAMVLLCEVAAGLADIRYRHDNTKLKENSESVQAIGQYYPHPLHTRPDGLKIPNGELIARPEDTGIQFNEFVILDESRVKIRYIVKIKRPGTQS